MFQLGQERMPERARCVFESVHDDPPDSCPAQLQQHTRGRRGQFSVHQERQGREELPQPLDAVRTRTSASEHRVDHRHVYRLGTDCIDRFWPGVDRLPTETIGIQRAQPEEALRGDGSEKQMSQIGP